MPNRLQPDSDGDRIVDSYEQRMAANACSVASKPPACSTYPFADGDLDGLSDCIEHQATTVALPL